MGLLAVRIRSGEEDGDFDRGICHSAGVSPCLKGWRQKLNTGGIYTFYMLQLIRSCFVCFQIYVAVFTKYTKQSYCVLKRST